MSPSLLQWWQKNQTKPKGKWGFLLRIPFGEGVMTFTRPVSFNLIVCIGAMREKLGNNRKEKFALLALIKK